VAKKNPSPHQEMLQARKRRDAEILRRAARKETFESIAARMGMTRQRIGQIVKAARASA
jgi:DNA-directed RNA polymerase sigma subunit (sigma70/sigma32)